MQLRPQNPLVGKGPKKDFDRIQDNPLRADGINGMSQADEQPFQVVFPGFLDLGAFHPHVIDDQLVFV